jgi:predicted subunit of tRNA(5-methylaminomethyl-2-thiouridylate) methyltransferase
MSGETCAVLFSGGTDSTCVAALTAEKHSDVRLLTFYRFGMWEAGNSGRNVPMIQKKFPGVRFTHDILKTDRIFQKIAYDRYLHYLWRFRTFMLSTCGFCSLSWHVRAMIYCLDHGVTKVYDGITRELLHFPGHMNKNLEEIRSLYKHLGISYENPVRGWDVPVEYKFLDKVTLDPHNPFPTDPGEDAGKKKTTGVYLYERGMLPASNVKGSELDRKMQQRCFQFVLFNLFVYWNYLTRNDYESYEKRAEELFASKVADLRRLLDDYKSRPERSKIGAWVER